MANDKPKHVTLFEAHHLQAGESVTAWIAAAQVEKAAFWGALIVTTGRVAYYRKGFFSEELRAVPLRAVTSVDRDSGISIRNRLRIRASGTELELLLSHKGNMHEIASAIESGRDVAVAVQR